MSKLRRLRAAFSASVHDSGRRPEMHRRRRPLAELLEERTLLSYTITVNTNADVIDPTFAQISLREAIEISNGTIALDDLHLPAGVSGSKSVPSPGSPPNPNSIQFNLIHPTVTLVNWGDGSKVPNSGIDEFIIGLDGLGLLHIRIFDSAGNLVTDLSNFSITPAETDLTSKLAQSPSLLPPHVLTGTEYRQIVTDVISIIDQPLLDAEAVIRVTGSALPTITAPVLISGYTQLGSSVSLPAYTEVVDNNAIVRIDGKGLGSESAYNGLEIAAPNCNVSGLIITGFSGYGISIVNAPAPALPAQGNWIWGNFLGALPDTTNANQFSNRYGSPQPSNMSQPGNFQGGIQIRASNNRVGGNTPGLPNVIANNGIGTTFNLDAPDPSIVQNGVVTPGLGVGILIDNDPGLPVNSPYSGTGNLIQGNAIIHNATQGIFIRSSNNTIGESIIGGGNVIAGNLGDGVLITGGPTVEGNRLLGNFIGTTLGDKTIDKKGEISYQNGGNGVSVVDSPRNTLGGTVITDRNVIGPNVLEGVRIMDSAPGASSPSISVSNRILNNYIGFNEVAGLIVFLPNQNGVFITTAGNFVGDAITGAGNTISNNYNNGVLIQGVAASGNTVQGNVIGLNPKGASAFRNAFDGVHIENAPNNIIGGTTDLARNTISSNNNGVYIVGLVGNNQATGNKVLGNFIGTDVSGVVDLGNAVDGVVLNNAYDNDIGDTTSGAGNVISGNNRGIRITGAAAINNRIRGNFIGTDLSGTALIHNEIDGILITSGASSNLVGGIVPGAGNTIVNNIGAGVKLDSGINDSILGNTINNNLGRGLTYPVGSTNFGSGIFLNPATAANNLQVAPAAIAANSVGTFTHVSGNLSGQPDHTYRIEIFSSDLKDPSGFGQGQTLLDSYELTIDPKTGTYPIDPATGHFLIDRNLSALVAPGKYISATATDETTGDTSAFSNAFHVPIAFTLSSASYTVNETASQIVIQVTRNSGVSGQLDPLISVPYTVGGGTAVSGVDYIAPSASAALVFKSTDPDTKTFTIPILNPHKKTGSLTANITLGVPRNGGVPLATAELGTPSSAVLTIVENDTTSVVQLAAAKASVNENAGSIALTVSRDTNVGTTTVNYTTVAGTATPGANYTTTSGTITFLPGQASQTINVPVRDNHPNQIDAPVNFTLNLSSPTNGVIGPVGSTLVTIVDTETPGTIQPSRPAFVANAGASTVSVQVVRFSGAAGTVTVHYATAGGTAQPGVDYTPISGTLQFNPGETTKTLVIPLSGKTAGPTLNFNLTLTAPTGGAMLGTLKGAVVTLSHGGTGGGGTGGGGTGPVTPPSTDSVPPTVVNFQALANPQGVYGLLVTFSEPMNASRANDVSNYGSFLRTPGPDAQFGTHDDTSIQIVSAGYDAASRSAVLMLASPLPFGTFAAITMNGNARLATPKGLTDVTGNYLDGSGVGNAPGSAFTTVFASGTALTYLDRSGDTVSLKLAGPGLMMLRRGADGEAQRLQLLGTVAGRTSLSGTVRNPRGGAGATSIPAIVGASGVAIKLRAPAFQIGGISAMAVDALSRSKTLRVKR